MLLLRNPSRVSCLAVSRLIYKLNMFIYLSKQLFYVAATAFDFLFVEAFPKVLDGIVFFKVGVGFGILHTLVA